MLVGPLAPHFRFVHRTLMVPSWQAVPRSSGLSVFSRRFFIGLLSIPGSKARARATPDAALPPRAFGSCVTRSWFLRRRAARLLGPTLGVGELLLQLPFSLRSRQPHSSCVILHSLSSPSPQGELVRLESFSRSVDPPIQIFGRHPFDLCEDASLASPTPKTRGDLSIANVSLFSRRGTAGWSPARRIFVLSFGFFSRDEFRPTERIPGALRLRTPFSSHQLRSLFPPLPSLPLSSDLCTAAGRALPRHYFDFLCGFPAIPPARRLGRSDSRFFGLANFPLSCRPLRPSARRIADPPFYLGIPPRCSLEFLT